MKIMSSWIGAIILASITMNTLLFFFFYNPADEIVRQNASTPGIMYPNDWVLYGNEGYGKEYIDANGYVNSIELPVKDYIIAVGASHTEGFHVPEGKKWTDYLNNYVKDRSVYNIAHSGYFFPDIVKHFPAIVGEFPKSSAIIIEVSSLSFGEESVQSALNQVTYDSSQSYSCIIDSLNSRDWIKHYIKKSLVLFRKLHEQYRAYQGLKTNPNSGEITLAKSENINKMLAKIRSEYEGQIIIVYHPLGVLTEGKGLVFSENDSALSDSFLHLCKNNNIDYIDLREDFEKAYNDNYIVPHGFWNTYFSSGHINAAGNKIFAKAVEKILED